MKFNWKIVLLFVLLLALVVPIYSNAVETEKRDTNENQEAIAEPAVEQEVSSEVPEKSGIELVSEQEEIKVEQNKKLKPAPKGLKAAPSIPRNSRISDIFPDPAMAESIADSLNKIDIYDPLTKKDWAVGDIISEADLMSLATVRGLNGDTTGSYIVSIEGIQYCSNLRTLDLSNQKIQDLSPLAKNQFPQMGFLYLSDNEISDVSPLANAGLIDLDSLDLDDNYINDLSSIADTALAYTRAFWCRNQNILLGEKMTVSSKKEFSIEAQVPTGLGKYEELASTTLTWSQSYMETKPNGYTDQSSGLRGPGVASDWKVIVPIASKSMNNSDHKKYTGDFTGSLNQPLEYILPPKITAYNDRVVYEIGTEVTEQQFLDDAKIVTDQVTEITSDFDTKVTSFNNITTYYVKVTASNIEGEDSEYIYVTFKSPPPEITADEEHTYLVGDSVTQTQFMQDVHAELSGGAPYQTIRNDFYKVNLNKAGDYVVALTCDGYPPSSESAVPVAVIVHVKDLLELQVPSSFRMDNNSNPNPVHISGKKQTLRCYGSVGNADLEVIDRRSIKQGWTIVGTMTPFTNSKGDILESSLKYQSQAIASSPVFLNTTNQPIESEEASTRTGNVSTTFDLQNQLSMEILPNDALVDDGYEASVTWTLEDVPRP